LTLGKMKPFRQWDGGYHRLFGSSPILTFSSSSEGVPET
jgi:hypothetical protein